MPSFEQNVTNRLDHAQRRRPHSAGAFEVCDLIVATERKISALSICEPPREFTRELLLKVVDVIDKEFQ